ncbi:MAG TPA: portal protein [Rhodanobacter sp.]|nr:portal protein [Rhodanobacter sp.]
MSDTYMDSSNVPLVDQPYRDRLERRKGALKLERVGFIPHYKELSQFIQPRRGRFFIEDRNRGGERYNSIINSKATMAHRVARAGLMAGSMSPARPWFELGVDDPQLSAWQPAKVWFSTVSAIIRKIFNESNFYNMSSTMLGEILLFATGAMLHVDDFEDVARFYTLTAGSYLIGQDDRQIINTLCREWELTTSQLVQKFGPKACSPQVQTAYDNGNYDLWWPITHMIEPNDMYDPGKKLSQYKKFASVYYETGIQYNANGKLLSRKGFRDFPAYVPRWDVTAEDIYGTDCPAMTALGDIKGLQIEERQKAQAISLMVRPLLKGPASLRNVPIESLPGGVTIYDGDAGKDSLAPIYTVNPQLQEMRIDIGAVEERIEHAFYNHLFRAISDMQGVQPRNQLELNQRDQERLLELGPVLEHMHEEFLAQVVSRTFEQAVRAHILPPAPKEIQGQFVKMKMISALATAQRSVSAGTIERVTTYVVGLVSGGFQHAADNFDADAAVNEYADVTGLSPRLIKGAEVVAAERKIAADQAAQTQKAAQLQSMAETANTAAGAAASATKAGINVPAALGQTGLQPAQQAVQARTGTNLYDRPGK